MMHSKPTQLLCRHLINYGADTRGVTLRMRVDQLFCKWKRANDSGGIQCTWAQSHLLIILIFYFLFSCFYRKMWQRWWMKEELIEIAWIRAIQEAICGFLLDEVINPNGEFHGDLRTSVAKENPTTRKLIRYYSWCDLKYFWTPKCSIHDEYIYVYIYI